MSKLENVPTIDNTEKTNSTESGDVASVPFMITRKMEQQLAEQGLNQEEIDHLKPEEAWEIINKGKPEESLLEKPKLTPEEQVKNLEQQAIAQQQEITKLTESIETIRSKLNKTREGLGLPPIEEDPPSTFLEKNRLEKLKAEKEDLEKQREDLVSQQEKERLLKEEKEKILQEKLDELFREFEKFSPRDIENLLKSGKTSEGRNVESKSMGRLDPEVAQSLAKAFKEGIKLLPKILEILPGLLKKFDEDLEKEATERVNKKLEEERQKLEEDQKKKQGTEEPKPEEKPEVSKGGLPLNEIKSEANQAEYEI